MSAAWPVSRRSTYIFFLSLSFRLIDPLFGTEVGFSLQVRQGPVKVLNVCSFDLDNLNERLENGMESTKIIRSVWSLVYPRAV